MKLWNLSKQDRTVFDDHAGRGVSVKAGESAEFDELSAHELSESFPDVWSENPPAQTSAPIEEGTVT